MCLDTEPNYGPKSSQDICYNGNYVTYCDLAELSYCYNDFYMINSEGCKGIVYSGIEELCIMPRNNI